MKLRSRNARMLGKLAVVAVGMFAFGYALIPLYRTICEVTGINILSRAELDVPGNSTPLGANTQVDASRTITVEFDANARGPWQFKPLVNSLQVHPGELATVMYQFTNMQKHRVVAQAIPSYAPGEAAPHFHKIQCFCFEQQTLEAGESRQWPVVFVIDPRLAKDVRTITLSYTFFEVGGTGVPSAAAAPAEAHS